MNPQKKLCALFLEDTIKELKRKDCDAVECVKRLRLFITVTGWTGSLRELLHANGFSSADYDRLLRLYNRQFAHQD